MCLSDTYSYFVNTGTDMSNTDTDWRNFTKSSNVPVKEFAKKDRHGKG